MSNGVSLDAPELPSVLFVDDEEDILSAIRSSLRKERKRFDFRFAVGGADALAQLEQRPADVIVSDMRMPGMDGAELLERAKAVCPESVRIVLTGEAEPALMRRSLTVAHQWLSKPCDRETLLAALEAAVRYRNLLVDHELKEAAARVDTLASPPRLYSELMAMAASTETSIDDIAFVAGGDPAVAAKLVQLANSAFSAGVPVVDVHGAIVRVGLGNLCQLVLSVELLDRWKGATAPPGLDLETNARLGDVAAHVSAQWCPTDAGVAGLGALLHNIGVLVEAEATPDRLSASYEVALDAGTTLVEVQRNERGSSHLDLAGHLLSIWGVPAAIALAVVGSGDPMVGLARDGSVADAVRLGVRAAQHQFGDAIGAPYHFPTTPDERALVEQMLATQRENQEISR